MTAAKTVESIPVRRFIIEATSVEMEAIELALDGAEGSVAARALDAVQTATLVNEEPLSAWSDLHGWNAMCQRAAEDPDYARRQLDHLQTVIHIHRPTSERSAR